MAEDNLLRIGMRQKETLIDRLTMVMIAMLVNTLISLPAYSKTMLCERWISYQDKKELHSIFEITLDQKEPFLKINSDQKQKYPVLRSGDSIKLVWVSANKLRAVGYVLDNDKELNSPVRVFDFDFGKLSMKMEGFGGQIDFLNPISSEDYQCQRLD